MAGRWRGVILPIGSTGPFDDGAGLSDGQLLGRFVEGRDEAAFEALVRRHGPMVLGVCRRLLRHEADVEDAFQATFLVLVRKAGTVQPRQGLGGWLHGVACRTALKARALAARRAVREVARAKLPEPAVAPPEADDLRPVIDRELSRLPERYRVPIVLCDLEGKPQKEAARELGCPEGTLSGRLTRARRLLAGRLARHVGTPCLSGGGVTALITAHAASAAVSAGLVGSTVTAARRATAGRVTGPVPDRAALLTERVVRDMLLSKLKTFALVVLGALLVGAGGASWLFQAEAAAPLAKEERPARAIALRSYPFDDTAEILRIVRRSGQVTLGPGRPPAGRLAIEFYFDGQKQGRTINGGGFNCSQIKEAWGKPIDFCIQAVDLDYLRLADATKGECRVLFKVGVMGSYTSTTKNIEKEWFDFAQGGSGGAFAAETSSGDDVPLFWMLTDTNTVNGANTVADLVRLNPKGKLAIVWLRLGK